MKQLLLAITCLLFFATAINAQKKYPYWSVGFNPLSMGESMSSIGPCVAYRISPRAELWGEASFIYNNLYKIAGWDHLRGFRFIFQPRYYTNKSRTFFIAPEFRLKQFSYHTSHEFINAAIPDTLHHYAYKASQVLVGGAFVFGRRFMMSARHHLFWEITAGIGGKVRLINRKNIPPGYKYETYRLLAFQHDYEADNQGEVYFPLGIRLIWQLNRKS